MNREIKFRAWDPTGRRMFEPGMLRMSTDGRTNEVGEIYGRYILLQYTGRKDKNKKDIYESDIVSVEITFYENENPRHRYEKYEIKWYDSLSYDSGGADHPGFYFSGYYAGDLEWHLGFNNCEVIGNIYEHSHLLKEAA